MPVLEYIRPKDTKDAVINFLTDDKLKKVGMTMDNNIDTTKLTTTELNMLKNTITDNEYSLQIKDSNKVNYLSPWIIFARKMYVVFGNDPDISMDWSQDENDSSVYILKMRVNDPLKAYCLDRIIDDEHVMGNITVKVIIIPANNDVEIESIFRTAFAGNDIFKGYEEINTPFGKVRYATFTNKIAQYYADDTSDPYGLEFDTYENIAREVLNVPGINFCTEPIDEDMIIWPS